MSVMNILRLELNYFRNYIAQKVELSPNVNIFSGDNAQGKTNLLEAVYFMSLGKSMRTPRDKELIMWDHKRGRVKAEISKKAGVKTVEIVLDAETNKRVAVNGMPITRIGELMGVITTVLFSPDEIDIIKDTPQKRRRFMDIALCQLSKSYFYCLSDYNKILAQRNKLLKKSAPAGAVEVWDMQLIARCAKITRTRREFVHRLEKYAAESHLFLTDGRENLQIKYEGTTGDDEKEIKQNFSRRLKDCMEIDYKHGYTHCGPQTDDLVVMLDGTDVRKFGSQGQQRSCALSLKLAEMKLYRDEQGEYTVLLLDDVFSELDRARACRLAEAVAGFQTIITCTHLPPEIISALEKYSEFIVSGGKITKK